MIFPLTRTRMFTFLIALLILSLPLFIAGCGGDGSDSAPQMTGFRGVVRENLLNGETIIHPNLTVVARSWVDADAGGEVARVTTDADGRFFIPLPPGTYAVDALLERPFDGVCTRAFVVATLREGEVLNRDVIQTNCH